MMKFFFILYPFLSAQLCAMAQQDYFLLFQSDHNQPYYILIDGKTFSSSETGRVSMASLRDTVYKITVGFPKDVYPKSNYTISINHKDQSFQLKDMGAEGWALFNTLSMELKMPEREGDQHTKTVASGSLKKEDAFARLMAGVVNDTSVMYNSYVEEEPKKEVPTPAKSVVSAPKPESTAIAQSNAPVIDNTAMPKKDSSLEHQPDKAIAKVDPPTINKQQKDSALVHKSEPIVAKPRATAVAKQEAASEPLYRTPPTKKLTSFVKLYGRQKTDTSLNLIFVDIPVKGGIDTVDIAIPIEHSVAIQPAPTKEEPKQVVIENAPANIPKSIDTATSSQHLAISENAGTINNTPLVKDSAKMGIAKQEIKKELDSNVIANAKPLSDSNSNLVKEKQPKDSIKMEQKKEASELMNKDCNYQATVYDIDKLRLKLMELDNEDDRITMVRKFVKLKCISVKQVNALSEVFKTDEGRYRLLDATYMHVSDIGQFTQLESLLVDPYYINRFRAMIR